MLFLSACKEDTPTSSDIVVSSTSCRGVYYERDSKGDLNKFNEYLQADQGRCLTDKISLTTYEASTEKRRKQNVKCKPQPEFNSKALRADNNYYSYRNDRYFLDFSNDGTVRRLTIGQDKQGNTVFQRDVACYYVRKDLENEPIQARDWGTQLMIDTSETPASSASFVPVEIFKITTDNSGLWFFDRYDETYSWAFSFCPQGTVPYSWCTALRNNNLYFDPVVDAATQADLLNQAKLIRTSFTFSEFSRTDFENLWNYHDKNTKELEQGGDWLYYVNHVVDAPKLFDHSWRGYIKRDPQYQTMPDVDYSLGPAPICYSSSKYITYSDNSKGKIYGETCFDGTGYVFTAY